MRNRDGFTLLEISLAIFIGVLIVTIAVPSIQGVVAEQRARKSFDAFEAIVRDAQSRSITERRAWLLVWDKEGVALRPLEPANKEEKKGVARFDFAEKQTLEPQFPAALVKNPAKEWTFWPSGTCEPAVIANRSEDGEWIASYDPLTVRAKVEVK